MNTRNQPSGDEHHIAAGEALQESMRLFDGFFACFGHQLRHRRRSASLPAVNHAAARMCGMPAEAFVDNTVLDLLGDGVERADLAMRRVLATGQPVLDLEAVGQLPTRTELGYWIVNYFPTKTRTGKVMQVNAVSIKVTKQGKLEPVTPLRSRCPGI
jgi:hypothetical protein